MPHDELLAVELVVNGDAVRIRADGEIDVSTAPLLDWSAQVACSPDADMREILLDLRGVTFCDASGLRALARLRSAAGEHGIGCEIWPSEAVSFVVEAADADALLSSSTQ